MAGIPVSLIFKTPFEFVSNFDIRISSFGVAEVIGFADLGDEMRDLPLFSQLATLIRLTAKVP